MRKQVILLIMLMVCVPLCSQNKYRNKLPQQHLKFMGIPIDGDLTAFTLKLIDKGFKPVVYDSISKNGIYLNQGISVLNGLFAGEECTITTATTPISKLVRNVWVEYPIFYNWSDIKREYNNLVDQYIIKYTNIKSHNEEMPVGYNDGDGRELEAIRIDGFDYSSLFSVKGGYITISIKKGDDVGSAGISIMYIDNINSKKSTSEENKPIQKDI